MQKLIATLLIFLSILIFDVVQVEAENIYSEKAWVVELNLEPLNDELNLSKVELIHQKTGEKKSIAVLVNDKTVEVIPTENLVIGEAYQVIINEGFESVNNLKLKAAYSETFIVSHSFESKMLKGLWNTSYNYNGEIFNLSVIFNDGKVSIKRILSSGNDYAYGDYNLINSIMEMNVYNPLNPKQLMLTLNGKIIYFNGTEIAVKSSSGKLAYFRKINDSLQF